MASDTLKVGDVVRWKPDPNQTEFTITAIAHNGVVAHVDPTNARSKRLWFRHYVAEDMQKVEVKHG